MKSWRIKPLNNIFLNMLFNFLIKMYLFIFFYLDTIEFVIYYLCIDEFDIIHSQNCSLLLIVLNIIRVSVFIVNQWYFFLTVLWLRVVLRLALSKANRTINLCVHDGNISKLIWLSRSLPSVSHPVADANFPFIVVKRIFPAILYRRGIKVRWKTVYSAELRWL